MTTLLILLGSACGLLGFNSYFLRHKLRLADVVAARLSVVEARASAAAAALNARDQYAPGTGEWAVADSLLDRMLYAEAKRVAPKSFPVPEAPPGPAKGDILYDAWLTAGGHNEGYLSEAGILLLPPSVRNAIVKPTLVRFIPMAAPASQCARFVMADCRDDDGEPQTYGDEA